MTVRWRQVKARDTFEAALEEFGPDVVLVDYSLPGFDGGAALEIASTLRPGTPVLIVSGSLLDEAALELIRLGARDYVLKSNLPRLAPSVRRALAEAEDVRERKRAQRLLSESEARFRGIVETAQEGIWMFDGGRTTYVNRRMADLIGGDAEALRGTAIGEIVDVDSRPAFESGLYHLAGRTAAPDRVECQLRRADGTRFWAWIAMSRMEGESGVLAMVTDVTTQRKLQEQLMVSDRLASVGTLAASVAHEMNNPLAAMISNLQLALADAGAEERVRDLREELQDSVACAERIRVIVRISRILRSHP